MEQQQETSPVTDQAAVADTSAPATEAAPVSTEAAPVVESATPVYEPNWKYQFDGAEKELDPFWRPLVKDKETNQKILDAVQQLEAFPKWKQKASEAEETVTTVKQLSELFQKNEHERVMEALGYTDEMIFEIARQKLERQRLPAEQKQILDEKRRLQLENEKLQVDNRSYQEAQAQELARKTGYELDTELGKAEYKKIVDAYDGAYGSGSFKEKVRVTGETMVRSLGRHVPPAELLQTVKRDFEPFLKMASVPAVEVPKVIPQVSGGNGSPGKKAVTSVEELRNRRRQLIEND
jgi:hypothetical protein